jgi:UDP-glucose 4-epimerase
MNLADAYVRALQCLCDGGESYVFNCGYGHGFSVRQVADVASRLIGNDIPIKASPRREGAPPVLVADCTKLKQKLDWKLSYDDLEIIIKTARYWGEKSVQR